MDDSLFNKFTKIAGVVSIYWCVSISLVFINKYLLKSEELNLDAPLFVTFFQCVCTVILSVFCRLVTLKCPKLLNFPDITFDKHKAKATFPLSLVFVSMIAFNNMCLQEVGIAFYTIARSLVTIFSIVFTFLILGKKTSAAAVLCCTIIIAGFCLGVDQEGDLGSLSVKGTVYGVVASAMVALNAIYIKKVLPVHNDNIWCLTYYNNINALAIFVPLIVLNGEVAELATFPYLPSSKFWGAMLVSGFFGFIMGFVAGLQVKHTSPVTHNISGVAKACCQTVIAVLYWSQVKTALWWCSTMLVLMGTGGYSLVKSWEMKKLHEQQKQQAQLTHQINQQMQNNVVVNPNSKQGGQV